MVKFPALAVLLMVSVLPAIPAAELSRPTLAAPLVLSELPDTAPVDDSAAPATVPVAVRAQETAPEASTPVVNTSVQFTSLHSSCSPRCPARPSSVAEPVRASESASRSVTETDSPSKAEALSCMLYRSSVPADCCTSLKVADAAGQPAVPSQPHEGSFGAVLAGTYDDTARNIDIGRVGYLRHSFIAGFPTERVPKMPLSGVSTRSGDLARFTFKGLDGTMTDLFIHLVAYQLVTLSGTGVSVLD